MSDRRLILIIDDEPTIVRGIQLRLHRSGFEAIAAYDGRSGVQLAIEQSPDLVVMDCQMPVVDGFGALEMLKQHAATDGIPVILASGQDWGRDRAIAAGAAAFLVKPYDGQLLLKLIDELTLARCSKISDRM